MTVSEAIALVDSLKPNKISSTVKVGWLSDIDGLICRELLETHEGNPLTEEFTGYAEGRDDDKELIVPFPYSTLYRWYLESQIDLANMEITKFNHSSTMYNNEYRTFADYWNRTHMPKGNATKFTFTARKAGEVNALSS